MSLGALLRHVRGAPVIQTSTTLLFSQLALGVTGIVAARMLGPSGRGVVGGVGAWMGVLPALFLLGMSEASSVRVARRQDDLGIALANALVFVAAVGVPMGVVAFLVVPGLVRGLGQGALGIAQWAVPMAIVTTMLSEILLRISLARKRLRVFNGCRLLVPLVPFAVVIGYSLAGGGLTPSAMIGANLAGALLCLLWVGTLTPWRAMSFERDALVSDLRFGTANVVGGWAGFVNIRLDVLLMSTFVSASQIGYYGVANNVMIPVITIPYAAANLLAPRVAEYLSEGPPGSPDIVRRQSELIRRFVRRYVSIAIAGGILLAVTAPFLIPLLFGHDFRPAVTLVWILIPGFVARAVTAIVSAGATGMRFPRIGNTAEVAALGVTVVLLAVLLPRFGATGAAIASTAAYATAALAGLAALRRVERRVKGARTEVYQADPAVPAPLAEPAP